MTLRQLRVAIRPRGKSTWRGAARLARGSAARLGSAFPLRRRRGERRGAAEFPLDVVPSVDGWRGFAVLLVLVFHCWYASGYPSIGGGVFQDAISQGYPIINYLFLISGFVMFLPTVRRRGSFGSVYAYGVRRVARLVPGYYLSLLGVVVIWNWARPAVLGTFWTWTNAETMLFHLFFVHWEFVGVNPDVNGFHGMVGFGIAGASWTLSIEAIFYILLPLVAGLYFRRPFLGLLLACAGQTLWRWGSLRLGPILVHHGKDPGHTSEVVAHTFEQFPGHIASIAVGMTTAWLYVTIAHAEPLSPLGRLRRYAPLGLIVGLLVLAQLLRHGDYITSVPGRTWTGSYYFYVGDVALAAAFAFSMLSVALGAGWLQRLWANSVARWLGLVSYGAYLWHLLVIHVLVQSFRYDPDGKAVTFLKFLAVVLPLSYLCGWLSYRFIEQPGIRLAKRHLTRRREAADRVVIHEAAAPAGANLTAGGA